ncbi:MAG: hypothetical protein HY075_16650, partial [Deltaproteobacteria bacterium]|nr:hypothetical protein [Deltaproteobacteria bacterium]
MTRQTPEAHVRRPSLAPPELAALACALALALFLRLHANGVSSYWYDELAALNAARDPGWRSIFWD